MEQAVHLEQLQQQLNAWLGLAQAIQQGQQALLRGNVAELERSTEVQAECCRTCEAGWPPIDGFSSASANDEGADLMIRIAQARQRVRHLNQVHANLLRRAQRSLQILRNLLTASGAAYEPPRQSQPTLVSLAKE